MLVDDTEDGSRCKLGLGSGSNEDSDWVRMIRGDSGGEIGVKVRFNVGPGG